MIFAENPHFISSHRGIHLHGHVVATIIGSTVYVWNYRSNHAYEFSSPMNHGDIDQVLWVNHIDHDHDFLFFKTLALRGDLVAAAYSCIGIIRVWNLKHLSVPPRVLNIRLEDFTGGMWIGSQNLTEDFLRGVLLVDDDTVVTFFQHSNTMIRGIMWNLQSDSKYGCVVESANCEDKYYDALSANSDFKSIPVRLY